MGKRKEQSSPKAPPAKKAAVDEPLLVDTLSARKEATLHLVDGTSWSGFSFGADTPMNGEVVFNTGMVGYPESLTDPSYKGQILVLTFPLVGNYGVPSDEKDEWGLPKFFESDKIQISGLIVSSYSQEHSHWSSCKSLGSWLKAHNIPAIYGIDTRAITKRVREKGAVLGKIVPDGCDDPGFDDPNKRNLVSEVSRKTCQVYNDTPTAKCTILALDCGMKFNIIRQFMNHNVRLKVVPWDYDFNGEEYDGLFLSNGPGDPTQCSKAIANIKTAVESGKKPIFGICLGNQLLALSVGCRTIKLPYGNRGVNQPAIDCRTHKCYITPQNHGFAVDANYLPAGWQELFINANDFTNEGIIHESKPFFSVQFHPEARGGPTDTEFLFDMFLKKVADAHYREITSVPVTPPVHKPSKVLLLGSGGLSIGQAGEFDYSGSQALKVLKEEGIFSVLINPNIATVQTSEGAADKVYFLPVTPEFVKEVIAKEKPDGIMCAFGGQTALNCAMQLEKAGVLADYNVKVMGTPISVIECTEDRDLFDQKLKEIHEKVAPGAAASTVEETLQAAEKIGYPVIIRAAFCLGGLGSGFANNAEELKPLCRQAFNMSPQVLVEKSMKGWKEVEYEVVRDKFNNCITVCNMENFDPLGVHTGDSIVIAPSQTLSNDDYYMLRRAAIKIIRHLGVVGECNIQYALNPDTSEYCVIEVNARLSRSSALASKATGYPLAYVAAKLALGHNLSKLRNSITKVTTACFEPAMDYVVIKFPRWDTKKFTNVDPHIGSAMKSVGEVMAIGRSFEECIQKAVRMVDDSQPGITVRAEFEDIEKEELDTALGKPTDMRFHYILTAFSRGYSVEDVFQITKIDRWFLGKLLNIFKLEEAMRITQFNKIDRPLMMYSKQLGFSDRHIGMLLKTSDLEVRAKRKELGVLPFVKQVDTLAGEFPAQTNYLYMTYHGSEHDLDFFEHGVMVLGCGAYRIGSSVEFDWCAVSAARTLRDNKVKTVMVNYNPETVSTDYDECDRLYFEELSFERVMDIYELEGAAGVVVSVGGQIPQNIAMKLHENEVKVFGTSPIDIDRAEDRNKFSQMLDSIGVDQPEWNELTDVKSAKGFCKKVGYPALIRPSYVLSGAAMRVVTDDNELETYLGAQAKVSRDHPVVISKFLSGAKEIEVDGVANNGDLVVYAVSEHLENAGVHSGDATLILPAQKLYLETLRRIKRSARAICSALNISGPFNIQFIAKDNDIKVIECNLRASRSFPFVSKTLNCNFIEVATKVMAGLRFETPHISTYDIDYVAIKCPMFSFHRLLGADPILGVEMASTGEVACFGQDVKECYLKSAIASGFKMPKKKKAVIAIGNLEARKEMIDAVAILDQMGYSLTGTPGTADFFAMPEHGGIKMAKTEHPLSGKTPNVVSLIQDGTVDIVFDIPKNAFSSDEKTNGYHIRRAAIDCSINLITNVKNGRLLVASLKHHAEHGFDIQPWDHYLESVKKATASHHSASPVSSRQRSHSTHSKTMSLKL